MTVRYAEKILWISFLPSVRYLVKVHYCKDNDLLIVLLVCIYQSIGKPVENASPGIGGEGSI